MPPCTTKRRSKRNLKTKKQPELTEYPTVWKSDNQGVKEKTFIQTGRRGRDGHPGGEDCWQGSRWRTGAGKATAGRSGDPTVDVQINQEEQMGSEIDHTTHRSSAGK